MILLWAPRKLVKYKTRRDETSRRTCSARLVLTSCISTVHVLWVTTAAFYQHSQPQAIDPFVWNASETFEWKCQRDLYYLRRNRMYFPRKWVFSSGYLLFVFFEFIDKFAGVKTNAWSSENQTVIENWRVAWFEERHFCRSIKPIEERKDVLPLLHDQQENIFNH